VGTSPARLGTTTTAVTAGAVRRRRPHPPRRAAGRAVGFIVPFLPGFLYAVLTGQDLDLPAAVLGLLLLIAVPLGGVLGGLRASRRTRREGPR
jgi:hypothetical protein